MSAIRVLQILTRPNLGGPMQHLRALLQSLPWRDDSSVEVLLAVGSCPADEVELDCGNAVPGGSKIVRIDDLGPQLHPLRDRRATAALRDLIGRFRPHVVHTHTSKAGFLGRRAALATGVPVLAHTFHGHVLQDYFSPWSNAVIRTVERRYARRTHLLFAVSDSCRDELDVLGVGTGRIHVVPPAVDLMRFSTARRPSPENPGIGDARPLVGFVGRMVPVKQPDLFVAMVRQLPGVAAMMFGDGPLLAGLRRAHAGAIRFMGAVSELQRFLPALDVLVLTSRREGCPLSALEARACGVALVGVDRPGIRDALGGGEYGVLVPPAAGAAGLAAAVRTLLSDHHRRRQLVTAGLSGLEQHDPSRVARALTQHYETALRSFEAATVGSTP